MRFFVAAISVLVVGLSAALLSPTAALACSPKVEPTNEHCYGIAQWDVEGLSGSGFKGLYTVLGVNSEALYAWTQEGYYNHISDEAWLEFDGGHYWNESGELLGCATLLGCTPEHADRWFWFARTEHDGEVAGESPEGGGAEEWEVADYYNPSVNGWYIQSKNWSGYSYGQPSQATSITAGVETTTSNALNSAGARDLGWEDLQGKWHYNDWSSGSGHALLHCNYPARVAWISAYTTFGYGVNIEWPCTTEDDIATTEPGVHTPPGLSSPPASTPAAAILPDTTATSQMTMPELKARATAIAASVGEPGPSSIEVAQGPRAQAVAAVTPGFSFNETSATKEWLSGATYALVLHGHFEAAAAQGGVPADGEQHAKPYTTLSLVLDARTGAVTTFELTNASDQQPVIGQLGQVTTP